ncbi:MAG: photosynthetic complex putative assembly protein PuhB [Pseudomonadota bacterium]
MSEFATEPVKGLPERLPAGERILWQGQPSWRALALRVFHVRKIAIYFSLILIWRLASGWIDGSSPTNTAAFLVWFLPVALAAVAIPALLAWLYARTTVFTITTRRAVMRYGVALPWCLNLPYCAIESASMRLHKDGTADIPLSLSGYGRISYLHLWPFARPWRINRPQPMLRGLPDGLKTARVVAQALNAFAETSPDGAVAMPVPVRTPIEDASATPAAAAA